MSDLDTQRAMFDRAGVVYETTVEEGELAADFLKAGDTTLTVRADDGPRQGGYGCFIACLHFTPTGDLRGVSAWE